MDESQFFNKLEDKYVTTGHMPHWSQRQKLYAVTFRLKDSLPKSVVEEYLKECEEDMGNDTHKSTSRYDIMMHKKMMEYLDASHGECLLKNKDIRDIVKMELQHIDEHMAQVYAYVIMPNHVHTLIEAKGDYTIQDIMHSIKRHTAIRINKILGRQGVSLWQREYFDRIIRSYDHFHHAIEYIINNPRHCKDNEYSLWIAKDLGVRY